MERNGEDHITLPDAAQRLGLSWATTHRLILVGTLLGKRDSVNGRWWVSRTSIDLLLAERDHTRPER
jgi:hypothetical protein